MLLSVGTSKMQRTSIPVATVASYWDLKCVHLNKMVKWPLTASNIHLNQLVSRNQSGVDPYRNGVTVLQVPVDDALI
jgi:hypothetical protein